MTKTRAEINREYRERHGERIKAARANRQPSITCVDCGEWSVHEAHGKCKRCYKREQSQRPGQRERNVARSAAWNEAHREERRRYFADRMANDPEWAEKRREHNRAMVARDRAAEIAKVRAWRKENPLAKQAIDNTRRARLFAVPNDLTASEWSGILSEFEGRCAYCGTDGTMTMDHVIPLVRGGHHIAGNVVPACRSCNSAKGALTAGEFLARRAKVLR